MSADSPARTGGRTSYGSGSVTGGTSPAVVTPQPVTDKSFIDSVTGFINEVVPTSYTATNEPKEQVQWARFESADINDVTLNGSPETDSSVAPPLLLILGYTTGVQVWSIPASGEATEVLSWRQGNVRVLRILPSPSLDGCNSVEDQFSHKRPLMAVCDTIAPGPHFCSLGFISLRDGDQVKSIQFKSPIIDVLANKTSVVVTFSERIAIFDACTLEDRMTVTSCYQSPGLCPNPVALGSRWLAYAERSMISAWRSSGGCEGEGVQSYTATVIHAAKSLGKGLRELGESVASSLTGVSASHHPSPGLVSSDQNTPGVVTVLDIQTPVDQEGSPTSISNKTFPADSVLAHFIAHSEPIVALTFDPTGLLLLTADKRGHDFHLFKIHTHPCGSALAAVHHLYILHRGDTTAKVQDISFSWDSRWVAVSTLRGTTHVFPVTPYGGPVGVRTHATPHVVNRLSRFHRSAGLSADGRSNSPVFLNETPSAVPYSNPRLPPFPHPTIVYPLAQIRQPTQFGPGNISLQTNVRSSTSRQRLSSASEDTPNLKLCAAFAAPRAWLLEPRETRLRSHRHTTDSLFIMACHGSLIQYDLDPKHATNIPREKVCDESTIELAVEAKARWMLLRQPYSCEIQPPLPADNPLLCTKSKSNLRSQKSEDEDRWLSQVEIVTHAGPHRRLWMGPQFMFKTYNSSSAVPLANTDIEAVEIGTSSGVRPARSNPVNMPHRGVGARPLVPVLIESTSASSYEQSPRLLEMHRNNRRDSDSSTGGGDSQLREDIADAMMESPGLSIREQGYGMGHVIAQIKHPSQPAIVKVVNPLGTVITLPSDEEVETPVILDAETVIHENCDETLFRPITVGAARNIVVNVIASGDETVPGSTSNRSSTSEVLSDSDDICLKQTIIPCTVEKSSDISKQNVKQCVTETVVTQSTPEAGKCMQNVSEHVVPPSEPKNFSKNHSDDSETKTSNSTISENLLKTDVLTKKIDSKKRKSPENVEITEKVTIENEDTPLISTIKFPIKTEKTIDKVIESPNVKNENKKRKDEISKFEKKIIDDITIISKSDKKSREESTKTEKKQKHKAETIVFISGKDEQLSDPVTSGDDVVESLLDFTASSADPKSTRKTWNKTENDRKNTFPKLPKPEIDFPELTLEKSNLTTNKRDKKLHKSRLNSPPKFIDSKLIDESASKSDAPIEDAPGSDDNKSSTSISKKSTPISYARITKTFESPVQVLEKPDTDSSDTEFVETKKIDTKKSAIKNKKKNSKPAEPPSDSNDTKEFEFIKKNETTLDIEFVECDKKPSDEYKTTQDSDENYVEAENCGLAIGETCTKITDTTKIKPKKGKNKKSKSNIDDFTEIIAIDSKTSEDDEIKDDQDEFLSLEPDECKDKIEFCDINYPDEDIPTFTGADDIEKTLQVVTSDENTLIATTNSSQTESDDSCKLIKSSGGELDSEEIEPLIPPVEESSTTPSGQLKANKKKSRKKRR